MASRERELRDLAIILDGLCGQLEENVTQLKEILNGSQAEPAPEGKEGSYAGDTGA